MTMFGKFLAVGVCAFLLIQSASSQCIGSPLAAKSIPFGPELPTAGGGFIVQSSSPIAPTGVKVLSDQLVIEGPLVIDGKLPFLGTVAVDGALPTEGAGSVAHSCGGAVGMTSDIAPVGTPITGPVLGGPAIGASAALAGPAFAASPAFGAGLLGARSLAGPGVGLGCGRGIL